MAWWLTVYCRKPVSDITPAQLLAGLRAEDRSAPAGVDYYTLAEQHDIDDHAMVDAALASLKVHGTGASGPDCEVRYQPEEDVRPIVLHHWTEPDRVAEELEEAAEGRSVPPRALGRLRAAKEVVGIELGFSQLEDMGIVLAYELGRYLAQKGEGLVVDDDNNWFAVKDGVWVDP